MTQKTVLILGATSSIARAAAAEFAREGYALYLAGRDEGELARLASDLEVRLGATVHFGAFDATTTQQHGALIRQVVTEMGNLEGVLLAFGSSVDQKKAEANLSLMEKTITENMTGACSILGHIANHLEQQKHGFIIAISSVAGDRGRPTNYIYGAAKAGLTTYLQGLRARLHPSGVRVITIKPGFVDTAMTFGRADLFAVAPPETIGKKIVATLKKRKDEVYLPGFWKFIMGTVKMIPEPLFKRMKL